MTKKGKYDYKYIWFEEKKSHTNTNIFGWQKRENIKTNTNSWIGILEYKYDYKYSSHTVLCQGSLWKPILKIPSLRIPDIKVSHKTEINVPTLEGIRLLGCWCLQKLSLPDVSGFLLLLIAAFNMCTGVHRAPVWLS